MPMPINTREEYEKVIAAGWYDPGKESLQQQFPCVLPFSQMYPLCCIDFRNFLNKTYQFSDDQFLRSGVIDEALRQSLDKLLGEKVCKTLTNQLQSNNLGQIVQIFFNFEHFKHACEELQVLLFDARSSKTAANPIVLEATAMFEDGQAAAEKRIFEFVKSKVDVLIDMAEYDWYVVLHFLHLTPMPARY